MAKKAAPRHVEPEDESQDFEEQEAVESQEPDEPGGKVSKAEAIRRALAAGHEGPQEGTAYILREFGLEVAPQHFSATKSQMKSRAAAKKGEPAKRGRKPKAEAPSKGVEGYLAPPPKQRTTGGEGDLLAAMEAMKPLVDSLGKDQVKRIVDLLG